MSFSNAIYDTQGPQEKIWGPFPNVVPFHSDVLVVSHTVLSLSHTPTAALWGQSPVGRGHFQMSAYDAVTQALKGGIERPLMRTVNVSVSLSLVCHSCFYFPPIT